MRVWQWAKNYGVDGKELIEFLKEEKGLVLTRFNSVDEEIIEELEEKIKELKNKPKTPPPSATPAKPKVILVKKKEEKKIPVIESVPIKVEEKPVEKVKEEKPKIEKPKIEKLKVENIIKEDLIPEIVAKEASLEEKIKIEQRIKKVKEKKIEPAEDSQEIRKEKDKKKSGKGVRKEATVHSEIEEEEIESPFKNLVIRHGAFKKFTPKRFKDVSKGKSKSRLTRELKRNKIQQRLEEEQKQFEEESRTIKITDPTTPQKIAEQINVEVNEIIQKLIQMGYMVTINQRIDATAAGLVAEDFGYKVKVAKLFENDISSLSDKIIEKKSENLIERAPIVTIMGHVDHGKTSLLDVISNTDVVSQEAGGITQHIGAYKINYKGKDIVFLDTPGHEAFTAMRARGANCTDLVILVVAADDGIMPQTVEALNHARAAKVPIIVAINKIDKPNANVNKVKQQLGNYDLLPEEWGGKTICVEISALKKLNIDKLLDMILLETELMELKIDADALAEGTVLESRIEKGVGPIINVLVQKGVLSVGDYFVAGIYNGKVKALINEHGERVDKVGPSTPVQVIGVNGVAFVGDPFNVVSGEHESKEISSKRQEIKRAHDFQKKDNVTLENIFMQNESKTKILNLILKCDVVGSVEAVESFLKDLNSDKGKINIIHSGVGGITDNDISLAIASNAIIIGFNVRADLNAVHRAEKENVEIRYYDIIFKIKEDIIKALEGMLETIKTEKIIGRAQIKQTFKVSKIGTIAGCIIIDGKATRNSKVRLIRDKIVIYTGELTSLKRFKDDASEVAAGTECGIGIKNYDDIKEGDELEFFTIFEKKQTL